MPDPTGKIGLHREARTYEAGYSILAESLQTLEADLSWLHPRERDYVATLRVDRRRESYLIGRKAAKQAIYSLKPGLSAPMSAVAIDFGVFHFPVVKSPDLHNVQVSYSHCDGLAVALAFPEDHPMGIDLEQMSKENIETMTDALTPAENGAIVRCMIGMNVGAAICWTAREALSKIFRTGLTIDCKVLELSSITRAEGSMSPAIYHCTFQHASQYRAVSAAIGDYICTIVLPRNTVANLAPFFAACRQTIP